MDEDQKRALIENEPKLREPREEISISHKSDRYEILYPHLEEEMLTWE